MGSDLFLHHGGGAPDDVGGDKSLSLLCPVEDQSQHLIKLLKVMLSLIHKQGIKNVTSKTEMQQLNGTHNFNIAHDCLRVTKSNCDQSFAQI